MSGKITWEMFWRKLVQERPDIAGKVGYMSFRSGVPVIYTELGVDAGHLTDDTMVEDVARDLYPELGDMANG